MIDVADHTAKGKGMNKNTFDVIILNGRPAAGKSEVIDFLKSVPVNERIERFHIGEFEEIDDFPILWERFEDDDLYEKFNQPRQVSNTHFTYQGQTLKGYDFKDKFFWNFLIEKLNGLYAKKIRDDKHYHNTKTVLVEFARGSAHGGFKMAYDYLSDEILSKATTLYIKVSWEESLRKNRRRFNPDKPDSILEHGLEDKKLEMMYKESDWDSFSGKDTNYLLVKNHKVPFGVFNNEPEITNKSAELGKHLQEVTTRMWANWIEGRNR